MDPKDFVKLKRAGFRIFRKRPYGQNVADKIAIWELSGGGRWFKFEGYQTQQDRDEDWKCLMLDAKNIGDLEE